MTFKVIVAGSREFNDWNLLKVKLDNLLANVKEPIEIVSGACPPRFKWIKNKKVKFRGADRLGEIYARINKYKLSKFPADWTNGRSGGPIRNKKMSKYADALVAFHMNNSRGTANMIKLAINNNLNVRIIKYEIQ